MRVLERVVTAADRRGMRMRSDRFRVFLADFLPAMYPEVFDSQ